MLAKERSTYVSACVVGPKEDEDTQRKEEIEGYLARSYLLKSQYVNQRERQYDVHLA